MIDDDEEDLKTAIHTTQGLGLDLSRQSACLVVIGGRTSIGKMFKLRDSMVVGRGETSDIVLTDDGISRKHARIFQTPLGLQIEDLGSTNGTFVNGLRVDAPVTLQDGDRIQIGSTAILKFSYQDALDEQLTKNLYESATRDSLTQVYNKKYLTEALEKEFAYAARHQLPMCVLMIDVDHFKKVNDTFGHLAGDHVLQKVAELVVQRTRVEDIVGRYGGEELTVILRQTARIDGLRCAERIRSAIAGAQITFGEDRIPVTVSIGLGEYVPGATAKVDDVLAQADAQLYTAKNAGRNRVMG